MTNSLTIIIVEKNATLKTLNVKDYKEEELYKKCGFKKAEDFSLQNEWTIKLEGQKYIVRLYGKLNGKANFENKYDFPPPVDKQLFFGSCCLVGLTLDTKGNHSFINLSIDLWNKMYEKLFGGFEDLAVSNLDDDNEDDELLYVDKSLKTKKGGYLKDGFVVDSDEEEEEDEWETDDNDEYIKEGEDEVEEELEDDNLGSELSEESYID